MGQCVYETSPVALLQTVETISDVLKAIRLKVLSSEKRGGLNLVTFNWSPFKLFTLKFSKESVQTLSGERPKTAQRTLFLLFERNKCLPITTQCRAAIHFSHHTSLLCLNSRCSGPLHRACITKQIMTPYPPPYVKLSKAPIKVDPLTFERPWYMQQQCIRRA